jgi:hypothetical protein
VPEEVWKQMIYEVDKNNDGQVLCITLMKDFSTRIQRHDDETCSLKATNESIINIPISQIKFYLIQLDLRRLVYNNIPISQIIFLFHLEIRNVIRNCINLIYITMDQNNPEDKVSQSGNL